MLVILIDSIIRRVKSVLCTIVLCMVSIVLIYFAVYIYKDNVYCKDNADRLLGGGIGNTGVLSCVDGLWNDRLDEFRNELYSLDGIEGVGATMPPGAGYFGLEDIYEIQSKYIDMDKVDQSEFYDWIYCTNIENTELNVLNLKLESGELISEVDQPKDVIYLYLGNNLSEIPIGTEYNISTGNGTIEINNKLIVKGILSKDSRLIDDSMFSSTGAFYSEKCFSQLDNVVLCVGNESITDRWLFRYSEDIDFNTAKTKIEEVAQKYGINVLVGNVQKIMEEKEEATSELNKTIVDLLVIAIIVSISIMVCMQIMLIINNLSEYGILCANGYSIRTICGMLIIENVIKTMIAFIAATLISWKLIFFSFAGIEEMKPVFDDIFFRYSVFAVGLCSI